MPTVLDVARYILEKRGPLSAMKLQKLVYYSQAWSLVWLEQPLFDDEIQAWANGPVSPRLYAQHRLQFAVAAEAIQGNSAALSEAQKHAVDSVLEFYGDKTAQWLSDLTHSEDPWRRAREKAGLGAGDRGTATITTAEMAEYYSSII